MKRKLLMTLAGLGLVFTAGMLFNNGEVKAEEVDCSVTCSVGGSENLRDDKVTTNCILNTGDTVQITSTAPVDSLYIKWDKDPGTWKLEIDGQSYDCGGNSIFHEFVELPKTATQMTITATQDDTRICDVWTFNGDTPDWVQKWEAPCEEADFLLLPAHADDEVLFMGSVMTNYAKDADIQVCLLTNFWDSEPVRSHELYNCLYYLGIRHAPLFGPFYDSYSEDLETAKSIFGYDNVQSYVAETVRRFKPQVLVCHDVNGEYGHGAHRVYTAAVMDLINSFGDAESFKESADKYGTWTPLKTYIHLYAENPIVLDTRSTMADYDGMTGLQVMQEAYKLHESQQWCWFYVSDGMDENGNPDGYEYSVANFGLFNTGVGADTKGNDMLENITTYKVQKEKKAEEESRAAAEAAQKESEQTSTDAAAQGDNQGSEAKFNPVILIIIIVVIVVVIAIVALAVKANNEKKRRRRRKRRANEARRAQERRNRDQGDRRPRR